MLFQKSINPEMVTTIGQEKIIPAIESSMSYATGGKLNDLQLNKLIDNMTVMKETFNPTNILKGDFGLDSLRAKSGIGERQVSEAEVFKKFPEESRQFMGRPLKDEDFVKIDQLVAEGKIPPAGESVSGNQFLDKFSEIKNRPAGLEETAIMQTIDKVDLPGKRASAREFLVNALKEGDDVGRTTFSNIIDPQDMKYIMEGGGGVEADPIVLIQKYFGPRVAELMPVGATTEQMAILTKRILENATDAKGLRPTDPEFDKFTLKLQESVKETPDGFPFAHGGRAGYAEGGWNPGVGRDTGGYQSDHGSYTGGDGNVNTIVTNTGGDGGGTGGTGITQVIKPELGMFQKAKNYIFGSNNEEEDDKAAVATNTVDDKMTTAANAITNFKDYNATIQNKNAAITEPSLMKDLGLADGGIAGLDTRQGYRFGGSSKILKRISNKMIKKAADDIFPTDDYKYDAEMVVDALVENNPIIFKNMLADDLDDALRSDLYGLAVRETGLRVGEKIKARRAAVDRGIVNEIPEPFKRESMKLADGVTGKGEKFKTFETTTPPRMFQLNVEKAVSELNIPREEAMRIAQLPSDQQKLALQKYMDTDMAQRTELMNYEPRKFDAAHGGLAKILEV
jgi:hypothetical protein